MNKCGFNPLVECNNECRFYDTCTRNPDWKPKHKDEAKFIATVWIGHTESEEEYGD